jgi:hypothetical protein
VLRLVAATLQIVALEAKREFVLRLLVEIRPELKLVTVAVLLTIKLLTFSFVVFPVVAVIVFTVTVPIAAKLVLNVFVLTLLAVRIPVLRRVVLSTGGIAVVNPVSPEPLPKKLVAYTDVAPIVAVLIADVLIRFAWILLIIACPPV